MRRFLFTGIALMLLGACGELQAPQATVSRATVQAVPRETTVEVPYGTSRKRLETAGKVSYSETRGTTLDVGMCIVAVDRRRAQSFANLLRAQLGIDVSLAPFKIAGIKPNDDPEAFWQQVGDSLRHDPGSMILYIHGYNTSFSDGALRAAQLSVDLEMPGRVALFSWPSRGRTKDYTFDEATIDSSEWLLQDFMVRLARTAGPRRLHVIVHSMGNRAFLRAIERVTTDPALADVKFGQIVMAAPDVDTMVFDRLASLLSRPGRDGQPIAAAATVYIAQNDRPLWFSSELHDAPRAGLPPPQTIPGVTVVNILAPREGVLALGHSEYATATPVVLDIRSLVRSGTPSAARHPARSPGSGFVIAVP